MALFLLCGMPLLALLAATAVLGGAAPSLDRGETAGALAWLYAAGLLSALPCEAPLLVARELIGLSYRSVRLYVAVALVEQALPLALALGCFLLVHLAPVFRRDPADLGSSVGLAVFLGGFFSILAVADYVAQRGELTGHALFLLPLSRMTEIVICARALPLAAESAGWRRVPPIAAMTVWPFLAAFEGLWSRQGRDGAALLLTVGLVLSVGAGAAAALLSAARNARPKVRLG